MFKNKAKGIAFAMLVCLTITGIAQAGAVGGPKYQRTAVDAYGRDTFQIQFYGNEYARIAVIGDGDTDLDLYVYDEFGNLIASDTDYSDQCVVEFRPRWTGYFKVVVRNRGSVYNEYLILTN